MTPKKKPKVKRDLAERIARDLFTDGVGRVADRLVLMRFDGTGEQELAGWGYLPFVNRIRRHITPKRKKRK